MDTVNYIQVVPQTFEEKVEMYMKGDKKELAEMLFAGAKYYPSITPNSIEIFMELDKIELAELLASRDKYDAATNPNSPEYYKYFENEKEMCESLDECINEKKDCVNCPFLDNKDKEINEPGYKYKTIRGSNGVTTSACIDTESM